MTEPTELTGSGAMPGRCTASTEDFGSNTKQLHGRRGRMWTTGSGKKLNGFIRFASSE